MHDLSAASSQQAKSVQDRARNVGRILAFKAQSTLVVQASVPETLALAESLALAWEESSGGCGPGSDSCDTTGLQTGVPYLFKVFSREDGKTPFEPWGSKYCTSPQLGLGFGVWGLGLGFGV